MYRAMAVWDGKVLSVGRDGSSHEHATPDDAQSFGLVSCNALTLTGGDATYLGVLDCDDVPKIRAICEQEGITASDPAHWIVRDGRALFFGLDDAVERVS